ncbi:MAG: alpha-L-glutamate ligase-like protein [Gammaproteobacteria bacterium]
MQNPFAVLKALKKMGILGMNQRNAEFIQLYNPRKNFPLVDNKILTKKLASQVGIGVPELYCVVEIEHQIAQLHEALKKYSSFVIKPAHGSGGTGIVVITGRRGNNYLKSDGTIMTPDDLSFHVSNTLSGLYSLGGYPDAAMIEYRVEFDPLFQEVSYQGVPDIRVIVFQGYPVMAMVRLPTRQSGGKANLHQGAIGVGVDIQTGYTRTGVQHNQLATLHPDTGSPVEGITIPHWEHLLVYCARCYELTGLGYIGADIVLDKNKGPMMLEMNARPGLAIQIANQKGLLPRLNRIKEIVHEKRTPEERVAFVLKDPVFK